MIADTKPLAEITAQALRLLYQQMGVVNTVRFISQFTAGYGNYTEEREKLFGDMSLDDIISAIKREKSQLS